VGWLSNALSARRDEERGAILVLSAVFMVVMVVLVALAVDIGFLGNDKRDDHKMADLAALDGMRYMIDHSCPGSSQQQTDVTNAVNQSLARNGYSTSGHGNSVTVELGTVDPTSKVFSLVADKCTATAVRVTVGSVTGFRFQPGSQGASAKAVADRADIGGFSIGSNVASLSTNEAALLGPILSQMICNPGDVSCSVTANAVGWGGLLNGTVTLGALQQQLVNGGLDVGSFDKLMNTNITLAQLYTASASALNNQGDAADYNIFNTIAGQAKSTQSFKLGDYITVEQGGETAALATGLNLFQLLVGSAEIANGNNAVSVPNISVTVPSVSSTSLSLTAVEKPKIYIGPAGGSVSTSQINMTVTPNLNIGIPLVATVTGGVPLHLTGGGAIGTLSSVACQGSPQSITVGATTQAYAATASPTLSVTLPLGSPLNVLNLNVNSTGGSGSGSQVFTTADQSKTWTPSTAHIGATTLSLSANVTASSSNSVVSNLINGSLLPAIKPVLDTVDSSVIQPLMKALGADVGSADIVPLTVKCGLPQLSS